MAQITLNSSGVASSGSLLLQTNGTTTQATLDTSGNLGLGVTPLNAYTGSGFKAYELPKANIYSFDLGSRPIAGFSVNSYLNSSAVAKYIATGYATLYESDQGQHRFYTAASGTAGNTITFTQAMTLDASGNLGIGATSPATPLHIYSGVQEQIRLGRTSSSSSGYLTFFANNSSSAQVQYAGILGDVSSSTAGSHGGALLFYTTGSGTSAERARITSSGFFKASNTGSYQDSAGSYFEFRSNQNAPVVYITDTIASGFTDTMIQARFTGYTPNTTGAWFLYCNDTTNQKAGILSTGTFESRTSTYGGVSDIKLKQDIVDATSQWDDIKAVRVRKFRFKDEPESALQIGVIAQELEAVSPGLVYETPDSEEVDVVNEDGTTEKKRQATGTTTKSVKYSILYMKAVAALQEAMNRIEQLEADVAALKGQA